MLAAALAWVAGTTAGTRWLLDTASRHAPLQIGEVRGRLADRLRLDRVKVSQAQQTVELESLELSWKPLLLLTGTVGIREISLKGLRIHALSPPSAQPLSLAWPRMPVRASLLDVSIARLSIDHLSYRRREDKPQELGPLTAAVEWHDGQLSLRDLDLATPTGRIAGSLDAGFRLPSLASNLTVTMPQPLAGMQHFSLTTRLFPAKSPEQLAGAVALHGSGKTAGAAPRLELSGVLGVTRSGFNLRNLVLTRPGRSGRITADGSLDLAAREPRLTLQMRVADLNLAPEVNLPTDLTGHLNLSGSLDSYRGNFAFSNRDKGWRAITLAADYQGSRTAIKLTRLNGALLDGTLQGELEAGWSEGLALSGELHGRRLNPARITPQWQGSANFDLSGTLTRSRTGTLQGKIGAILLESRLHGQPLTGELQADLSGDNLRIGRLLLHGRGFDLEGSGQLDSRLNLSARISDLSRLLPGTAGELQATGWLRRRQGQLAGALTARGRGLAGGGAGASSAAVEASIAEGAGHPLHLALNLAGVAYGSLRSDAVVLEGDGTLARHTLRATLRANGDEAHLGLSGGYAEGAWQGAITHLSGGDGIGPWSLAKPAPLTMTSDQVTLAPLVLAGAAGERIEVAGRLARQPLGGTLRAEWDRLNLARANAWLPDMKLSGTTGGTIRGELEAPDRLTLTGKATMQGTVAAQGRTLSVRQSELSLDSGRQGGRATMEVQLTDGTQVRGSFVSNAPLRPALPESGDFSAEWNLPDLSLLSAWVPAENLQGQLAGQIDGRLLPGRQVEMKGRASLTQARLGLKRPEGELDLTPLTAALSFDWRREKLTLNGQATTRGTVIAKGRKLTVQQAELSLDGGRQGMQAAVEVQLTDGSRVRTRFASTSPLRPTVPETGRFSAEWHLPDLSLLSPWLPAENLQGQLDGQIDGRLLPNRQFELKGRTGLSQARLTLKKPEGELNFNLRKAALTLDWHGQELKGDLDLALAEQGQARARLQLPLPARIPVAFDPKGELKGSITGKVQEKGVLTALFPGMLQESHGELTTDLRVGGTWEQPRFEGLLQLAGAGAYLPTAGIRLRDLQLTAHLEKDLIRIDTFRAASGPGHIEGSGLLRLKGWQPVSYSGRIDGENFQTVHFPEIEIQSTPKLTFEGTPEKLSVQGEVRLPVLRITAPPLQAPIGPSKDVIVVGRRPAPEKGLPLAVDARIRLVLGDRVLVKMSGIDAQLGGAMDLTMRGMDKITSSGEIRVVKGRYQTYGVTLDIVRGRLYYGGGPINQPTLDILALRTSGDVKAGVTIGGTLQAPVTKLYSEPPMPDVDILAYVVLGHPLGSSGEQAGLLAQAAGALLSAGQSASLQDQIKSRLGLSTLEIQSAPGATTGHMGYKPMTSTPPGTAPTVQPGGLSQTMVTIGKYLTPQIYVSYGRSLFTNNNLFLLRYDITRRWQIETQTGEASGLDVYYKIEFN
ncbi:hypothetical protein GSbR_29610 [Geobacter sp. SVR]|nr:hypothetical protein GSVR_31390 [Geobacter sp. SVR]GCF86361.1 hypothetical protein GSbR_29610 [Geobacter sp. SVR]